MWNSYQPGLVFLWILSVPTLIIAASSYVRHLASVTDINHLTYFSSFKWLYVASINSLTIYDDNLTLLQHVSIENITEKNIDPCAINPCQCLHNVTESDNEHGAADRNRRSQSASAHSIDANNYNLILYLEQENRIENQPYLIDCWSLQTGSCIVRNALNLSDIYYRQQTADDPQHAQKLLFNTDSSAPNHVFPFHLKLNKCNSTPTYLFLTSTLRKNLLNSNNREKLDNRTDRFDLPCLEQAQRRTIALRAFVDTNERRQSSTSSYKSSAATLTTPRNAAIHLHSWTQQQHAAASRENSLNNTRPSSNNNKSNLRSSASLLQSSSMISMASDAHPLNSKDPINQTSSSSLSMTYTQEQGPFVNINDYCPEQLSVLRSIYTDFFERESSEKYRLFQDIVYDRQDAAIYVFTNQQHHSKVIRLCEGQISFRHYVELPIHCGDEYTLIQKVKLIPGENGKEYLLVIASKPRASQGLEPSVHSHSALCLYEFDQIRNAFVDSVLDLAKGNVSLGMAWLHGESVVVRLLRWIELIVWCCSLATISDAIWELSSMFDLTRCQLSDDLWRIIEYPFTRLDDFSSRSIDRARGYDGESSDRCIRWHRRWENQKGNPCWTYWNAWASGMKLTSEYSRSMSNQRRRKLFNSMRSSFTTENQFDAIWSWRTMVVSCMVRLKVGYVTRWGRANNVSSIFPVHSDNDRRFFSSSSFKWIFMIVIDTKLVSPALPRRIPTVAGELLSIGKRRCRRNRFGLHRVDFSFTDVQFVPMRPRTLDHSAGCRSPIAVQIFSKSYRKPFPRHDRAR